MRYNHLKEDGVEDPLQTLTSGTIETHGISLLGSLSNKLFLKISKKLPTDSCSIQLDLPLKLVYIVKITLHFSVGKYRGSFPHV